MHKGRYWKHTDEESQDDSVQALYHEKASKISESSGSRTEEEQQVAREEQQVAREERVSARFTKEGYGEAK